MNLGNSGLLGKLKPTVTAGIPMVDSKGNPYYIWVPKIDLDDPVSDLLSPYPQQPLIKETLTHIDF